MILVVAVVMVWQREFTLLLILWRMDLLAPPCLCSFFLGVGNHHLPFWSDHPLWFHPRPPSRPTPPHSPYIVGIILRIRIHNSLGVDAEQSTSHGIEDTCGIVDDSILCPFDGDWFFLLSRLIDRTATNNTIVLGRSSDQCFQIWRHQPTAYTFTPPPLLLTRKEEEWIQRSLIPTPVLRIMWNPSRRGRVEIIVNEDRVLLDAHTITTDSTGMLSAVSIDRAATDNITDLGRNRRFRSWWHYPLLVTDQEEEHIQHLSIRLQQQQQIASSKTIVVKNYDTRTQVRLGCREHHRWVTVDAMLFFGTSSVWPSRVDAMLCFGGVSGLAFPIWCYALLSRPSLTCFLFFCLIMYIIPMWYVF